MEKLHPFEESKSQMEMEEKETPLDLLEDYEVGNITISIPQIQNPITICWAPLTKEFMDYLSENSLESDFKLLLEKIDKNT